MTPDQIKMLDAPLARSHIKSRAQAGRQLSYIEGWHAIAEANRIFGFDGWNSETIELKCVAEKDREIGQYKKPGFGVSYIARVRIHVGDIVREGVGAGHGIDADLGLAHESAIKEAETDARKRALMTFGNPFGLALYDKERNGVADDDPGPQEATKPPPPAMPPLLPPADAAKVERELTENISGCVSLDELDKFIRSEGFVKKVGQLPERNRAHVRQTYQVRGADLKKQKDAA